MKTAERTIERPRVERAVEQPPRRRSWVTLIAALVALVLGLLGGYLLRGSDDVDPTAPVVVGGAALTDRQAQMVDLVDDYVVAWQRGDGAAAESMFTDDGVLDAFGAVRTADDGGIAGYVAATPTPLLRLPDPVLIDDHQMLMLHTIDGSMNSGNLMTFTETGDLLIVRHVMFD